MLSPVVLFVYNRPEHTIKTIEALSKNKLAKESSIYIFSDAAKNESSSAKVEAVRDYIDSIEQKEYFKSVTIKKAKMNKGLANSVIDGVSEIVNEYGNVIVLEDDLITSPYFLSFMNDALDYYKNEKKVFAISGYSNIQIPSNFNDAMYFAHISTSWGWATWSNEWNSVDWKNEFYLDILKDKNLIKDFKKKVGNLRVKMLEMQTKGQIDSWAVRRLFSQLLQEKYTAFPVKTLVNNIGHDGSGIHSGKNKNYDRGNDLARENLFGRIPFKENIEINKLVYEKNHATLLSRARNKIKRTIGVF